MRNHKVAVFFFRRLPHLEVAVFGALRVRFQTKIIAFFVVHGFMVRLVSLHHVFDADWLLFLF